MPLLWHLWKVVYEAWILSSLENYTEKENLIQLNATNSKLQ